MLGGGVSRNEYLHLRRDWEEEAGVNSEPGREVAPY